MRFKKEIALFFTVIFLFGCANVQATKKNLNGYTIKSVEGLYQACLTAQNEFKDKPNEIGNSVCGAYIQGFVLGGAIAALHIFPNMPEESNMFYYKQFAKNYCMDLSTSVSEYIADFIKWREKHRDFNDASYSGLIGSVYESEDCKAKNAKIDRKWEKYNGKN